MQTLPSIQDAGDDVNELTRVGPPLVVAVCVRDHWEEMSDDEREWCAGIVCAEVERTADFWDPNMRTQRFDILSADRPCAFVLPLLFGKLRSEVWRSKIMLALAIGLTHAIDEVNWFVALGMGKYLWAIDREFALRCVNAFAAAAILVQQIVGAEMSRPFRKRRKHDEIEAEMALLMRQRFFEAEGIANDAYQAIDLKTWWGG